MFPTYDDWKMATPPEYEWDDIPIHDEDIEPAPSARCFIELDDRNDPPILE
jgi:hypothetical protein